MRLMAAIDVMCTSVMRLGLPTVAPQDLRERRLVPEEGVEPTHSCLYGILSPARLPVPPFRHELDLSLAAIKKQHFFKSMRTPYKSFKKTFENRKARAKMSSAT